VPTALAATPKSPHARFDAVANELSLSADFGVYTIDIIGNGQRASVAERPVALPPESEKERSP